MSKVVDDFVAMVRKTRPDCVRGQANAIYKDDMKKWGAALKRLLKKLDMPIIPELIELGDAMKDTYLLVVADDLQLEFRPPDSLESHREAILEQMNELEELMGEEGDVEQDFSTWKVLPVFHHLNGDLDLLDFENLDPKTGKCPITFFDFYEGFMDEVAPSLPEYLRKLTKAMKEYEPEDD